MLSGNENGFVWRGRGTYQNAYSLTHLQAVISTVGLTKPTPAVCWA
jgi:hypothetical protein